MDERADIVRIERPGPHTLHEGRIRALEKQVQELRELLTRPVLNKLRALAAEQEPLGAEFAKVLDDALWASDEAANDA